MTQYIQRLLGQPLHKAAELMATDIPIEPGIYAWYHRDRLFYVGESRRGLRSRVWRNHLRGNTRGSTLRNKVAKAYGFPPTGFRAYGSEAERVITLKLLECEIRYLAVPLADMAQAQSELIKELDPPMNDHPGQVPRWRCDEVREILDVPALDKESDGAIH